MISSTSEDIINVVIFGRGEVVPLASSKSLLDVLREMAQAISSLDQRVGVLETGLKATYAQVKGFSGGASVDLSSLEGLLGEIRSAFSALQDRVEGLASLQEESLRVQREMASRLDEIESSLKSLGSLLGSASELEALLGEVRVGLSSALVRDELPAEAEAELVPGEQLKASEAEEPFVPPAEGLTSEEELAPEGMGSPEAPSEEVPPPAEAPAPSPKPAPSGGRLSQDDIEALLAQLKGGGGGGGISESEDKALLS